MKKIRIGSGAGYSGDRLEPALEVIEKGNLDYVIFETLAERTIAIAQQAKLKDPNKGYNGLLEYRMEKVLPLALKNDVKIITNMGAANPVSAIKVVKEIAERQGLTGLKLAAVLGDDIFESIEDYMDYDILELDGNLASIKDQIVSANVYMGSEGIVEALENGANLVITGRCSDPALVVGPLAYEFGWSLDETDNIGMAIMVGHLLECGGQITGGYYADSGLKDVEEPWNLGFPIAEVAENGDTVISKVDGSGGVINRHTATEQLLYEIHDPSAYVTPDGISDYRGVEIKEVQENQVLITGAKGKEKPETLKVSIGYRDGFIAEGEISYGGFNALERAKLAGEIVSKRLDITGAKYEELRIDYIGVNSLYKDNISSQIVANPEDIKDVRLRVAARTNTREEASKIVNEVETLYTNGPAAGGGATKNIKEIIGVCSIFVPRDAVKATLVYEEV